MANIFISYRRRDNAHAAGRLYDQLALSFGTQRLFMDVDTIPPGVDFVGYLEREVASCNVLLAVIGQGWLTARDAQGHSRLWNPLDFVHIEIATALRRGIPLIPVLVDGASMPVQTDLPVQLRQLTRQQAVTISHEKFGSDTRHLVRRMKPLLRRRIVFSSFFARLLRRDGSALPSQTQREPPVLDSQFTPVASPVAVFASEQLAAKDGSAMTVADCYEHYCSWCERRLLEPRSVLEFAAELSKLGFRKGKVAGRVHYMGVALKSVVFPTRRLAPATLTEIFYRERINVSEATRITATELYEDYVNWCESHGKKPAALPSFSREFAELGIKKEKVAGRVRFVGIALKTDASPISSST